MDVESNPWDDTREDNGLAIGDTYHEYVSSLEEEKAEGRRRQRRRAGKARRQADRRARGIFPKPPPPKETRARRLERDLKFARRLIVDARQRAASAAAPNASDLDRWRADTTLRSAERALADIRRRYPAADVESLERLLWFPSTRKTSESFALMAMIADKVVARQRGRGQCAKGQRMRRVLGEDALPSDGEYRQAAWCAMRAAMRHYRRDKGRLDAFLLTVADRAAVNLYRDATDHPHGLTCVPETDLWHVGVTSLSQPATVRRLEAQQTAQWDGVDELVELRRLLRRLRDRERDVLVAMLEGYSIREAAARLGIAFETARRAARVAEAALGRAGLDLRGVSPTALFPSRSSRVEPTSTTTSSLAREARVDNGEKIHPNPPVRLCHGRGERR